MAITSKSEENIAERNGRDAAAYARSDEVKQISEQLVVAREVLQRYIERFGITSRDELSEKMAKHGFYRLNTLANSWMLDWLRSDRGDVNSMMSKTDAKDRNGKATALEGLFIVAEALGKNGVSEQEIGQFIAKRAAVESDVKVVNNGKVEKIPMTFAQMVGAAYKGMNRAGALSNVDTSAVLEDFTDEMARLMQGATSKGIRNSVLANKNELNALFTAGAYESLRAMSGKEYKKGALRSDIALYQEAFSHLKQDVQGMSSEADAEFGKKMSEMLGSVSETQFQTFFAWRLAHDMFKNRENISNLNTEMKGEALRYTLANAGEYISEEHNWGSKWIAHANGVHQAYYAVSRMLEEIAENGGKGQAGKQEFDELGKEILKIMVETQPEKADTEITAWQRKVLDQYKAVKGITNDAVAFFFSSDELDAYRGDGKNPNWEKDLASSLGFAQKVLGVNTDDMVAGKMDLVVADMKSTEFYKSLASKGYTDLEISWIGASFIGSASDIYLADSRGADEAVRRAIAAVPPRDELMSTFKQRTDLDESTESNYMISNVVSALYHETNKYIQSIPQKETKVGWSLANMPDGELAALSAEKRGIFEGAERISGIPAQAIATGMVSQESMNWNSPVGKALREKRVNEDEAVGIAATMYYASSHMLRHGIPEKEVEDKLVNLIKSNPQDKLKAEEMIKELRGRYRPAGGEAAGAQESAESYMVAQKMRFLGSELNKAEMTEVTRDGYKWYSFVSKFTPKKASEKKAREDKIAAVQDVYNNVVKLVENGEMDHYGPGQRQLELLKIGRRPAGHVKVNGEYGREYEEAVKALQRWASAVDSVAQRKNKANESKAAANGYISTIKVKGKDFALFFDKGVDGIFGIETYELLKKALTRVALAERAKKGRAASAPTPFEEAATTLKATDVKAHPVMLPEERMGKRRKQRRGLKLVVAPPPVLGMTVPVISSETVENRIPTFTATQTSQFERLPNFIGGILSSFGQSGVDLSNQSQVFNAFTNVLNRAIIPSAQLQPYITGQVSRMDLYIAQSGKILTADPGGARVRISIGAGGRVSISFHDPSLGDVVFMEGTIDVTTGQITKITGIRAPVYLTLNNLVDIRGPLGTQITGGTKIGVPFWYNPNTKLPRKYAGGPWDIMPFAAVSRPFSLGQGWVASPYIGALYDYNHHSLSNYGGLNIMKTFQNGVTGFMMGGGVGVEGKGSSLPFVEAGMSLYGAGLEFIFNPVKGEWLGFRAGYDKDRNGTVDYGVGLMNAGPILMPDVIIDGQGVVSTLVGMPIKLIGKVFSKVFRNEEGLLGEE